MKRKVNDNDVPQEESKEEEAIQESLSNSVSNSITNNNSSITCLSKNEYSNYIENKNIMTNGKLKNAEISTYSTVLKPTDIENPIIRKICKTRVLGPPNDSWIVTPLEKKHKCQNDDLKDRWKGKEESDNFSTPIDVMNGSRVMSETNCSTSNSSEPSTSSNCMKRKLNQTTKSYSEQKKLKKIKHGNDVLSNVRADGDCPDDLQEGNDVAQQTVRNVKEQNTDHDFVNGNNSAVLKSSDDSLSILDINPTVFDSSSRTDTIKDDDHYCELSRSIPDDVYVALDCEMVGVGEKGRKSVLGRCSIVDYNGKVLYDKYVRPTEVITDFRTRWSGIRPCHMKSAIPIEKALQEIKDCLKNKIVVGHAVYNDFKVIKLEPIHDQVRDTATCKLLCEWAGLSSRANGLKKLAAEILDQKIQVGNQGHCSVEDARASLGLFKHARSQWEPQLLKSWAKKGIAVEARLHEIIHKRAKGEDYLEDKFWPSHVTG